MAPIRTTTKFVAAVSQIGGVRDFTFNESKQKGVRAIEIDTGVIRPDRGMDIAQASYRGGVNLAWMSKTGIIDPRFYEKDGKSFLRDFFGGLLTTCGLKNKDKKGEYVVLKPFEEYNTYLKFSFGKKF